MRCARCGVDEMLPYRCAYCNQYHCSLHRLPEQHDCPGIHLARSPLEIRVREGVKAIRKGEGLRSLLLQGTLVRRGRAIGVETIHLTIGSLLVLGVGLSLFDVGSLNPLVLLASAVGFMLSFLVHELSHKYVAIRSGCLARFRLHIGGAALTAASIFLPIKFIAPGAVMLVGYTTPRTLARIAAAGPVINIGIAIITLLGYFAALAFSQQPGVVVFFRNMAYLNALIALFNLIPFGPLDGLKVYYGSPKTWVAMFALSLSLFLPFMTRMI